MLDEYTRSGPYAFGFASRSPHFLTSLPTEPDQLSAYLRARVSGSSSQDEAVFVAIGDVLR